MGMALRFMTIPMVCQNNFSSAFKNWAASAWRPVSVSISRAIELSTNGLATAVRRSDYPAARAPPSALSPMPAITWLKAVQQRPEWQAAAEALLLVAESDGLAMVARIGIMQALNQASPSS
jgi:hypothetical protein